MAAARRRSRRTRRRTAGDCACVGCCARHRMLLRLLVCRSLRAPPGGSAKQRGSAAWRFWLLLLCWICRSLQLLLRHGGDLQAQIRGGEMGSGLLVLEVCAGLPWGGGAWPGALEEEGIRPSATGLRLDCGQRWREAATGADVGRWWAAVVAAGGQQPGEEARRGALAWINGRPARCWFAVRDQIRAGRVCRGS